MQTHPLVHYRFVLLLLGCSVLASLCLVGCVEERPETPLPSHDFDLSRFSESVEFLKTKFKQVDHDYWTIDDNAIWQLKTETDEVTFPSHFATLDMPGDGFIFNSKVFCSSVGMSHQDARTLALQLGKMVHATPEQLAKLEAWPQIPKGSLANVVDIKVRTDDRTFDIKIREGFDPRLPARVLFDMYDTTDAKYGRKEPEK